MSDSKDKYKCNICPDDDPFTSESIGGVKIHIGKTSDKRHKDRKGTEPGVVEEINAEELMELNNREDHDGKETVTIQRDNRSYTGSAIGLDLTGQTIGERPVKGKKPEKDVEDRDEEESAEEASEAVQAILLALTRDEALEILNAQDVSESTRREILEQLMNQ